MKIFRKGSLTRQYHLRLESEFRDGFGTGEFMNEGKKGQIEIFSVYELSKFIYECYGNAMI